MSGTAAPLIEVEGLVKHFPVGGDAFGDGARGVVHAVDGIDFTVGRGETLAIVGESGCGKSTVGRLLINLLAPTAGRVRLGGTDITGLSERAMRPFRRRAQMVFQDPFASLNPRMSVGDTLAEPLAIHGIVRRRDRPARVRELLAKVGLDAAAAQRYPHEFSGGQRQRIGIARALAAEPELIVGDEPVSALDVSIQAQIINLLEALQRELGLTLVIIAHDLAVVRHIADRVLVMYLGKVVELAPAQQLFTAPRHPYTQALIAAVPRSRAAVASRRPLAGDVPSPVDPPGGCRFRTRCPYAQERCREPPPLERDDAGHNVACHFWRELGMTGAPPAAVGPSPAYKARLALFRGHRGALAGMTGDG
ncbi:MAG: ATP-binding cassette domain-containing protein [Geminicoccaceae bacterium]